MKKLQEIHIKKELLISLISERCGNNLSPARELLKNFDDIFVIKEQPYHKLEATVIYKEVLDL